MKKTLITLILCTFTSLGVCAQQAKGNFNGYFFCAEYEVFLKINFEQQNIVIPQQEIYGELPGYLGKKLNPFCWPITSAKMKDEKTALVTLINDYGSEDLQATITATDDSTLVLRQGAGSSIKVPKNGKWQKLPKMLTFKRQ